MSSEGWMRMAKLHGANIVLTAAKHNKREEAGGDSDINPVRSDLNRVLRGPPDAKDVATLAKSLMSAVGIERPKRSAVVAIEFLFSLPPNSPIEPIAYFTACTEWVARRFGGEQNILSSDVHFDEAAPHCHVLQLPLVSGKMNGSDLVGVGKRFQAHIDSFHAEVAGEFGLPRPSAVLRGRQKLAGARSVLARLAEDADPAMVSAAWPAIVDSINRYPDKYMADLGIPRSVMTRSLKTLEQIALSRGKGPKTEAEQARRDARLGLRTGVPLTSPIRELTPARDLPLSCVGELQKLTLPPLSAEHPDRPPIMPATPSPPAFALITRERESDRLSSDWDEPRGEMRPASHAPAQSNKAAAKARVESMLLLQEETA